LAASAAAASIADRSAGGFAPCMVETTEPFFNTKKVGILGFSSWLAGLQQDYTLEIYIFAMLVPW